MICFAGPKVGSDIFEAIKNGDTYLVKRITADKKFDWDQSLEYGITPMHEAVLDGNVEIITMLLDAGAKTDPNSARLSPLMEAVRCPRREIVLLLIKRGADVNAIKQGSTALGIAAQTGDFDIAAALIQAGANVNLEGAGIAIDGDNRPCSPLIWASQNNVQIAKLLIKSGADVNAKDPIGNTSLMYANNLGLVKELIKAGADVNATNSGGWTALMYLAGGGAVNRIYERTTHTSVYRDDQAEDLLKQGKTPMEAAVLLSRMIAESLLKAGADPQIKEKRGMTALDIAKSVKRTEIIELLSAHSMSQ